MAGSYAALLAVFGFPLTKNYLGDGRFSSARSHRTVSRDQVKSGRVLGRQHIRWRSSAYTGGANSSKR